VITGTGEKDSKLRQWRRGERLTLDEVSGLTGVSVPMLSQAETGKRRLSRRAKVLIARRLGVALGKLFDPEPLVNGMRRGKS
jgi:transcriptional regulator with XRE-family HTH domain